MVSSVLRSLGSFFIGSNTTSNTGKITPSFEDFIKNYKKEHQHVSSVKLNKIVDALTKEYEKNAKGYDSLLQKPDLLAAIAATIESNFKKRGLEWNEDLLIKPVLKEITAKANNTVRVSPLIFLGTLFLMFGGAYAQNNFTPHSGQPSGGKDLCDGKALGCDQGFTTRGAEAFDPKVDSQYSRIILEASNNPKDRSAGAREQIRDCFPASKVGQLVANVRNQSNSSQPLALFHFATGEWEGYRVEGTASNVPKDEHPTLESNINEAFLECQSDIGALLNGAKIAGIVIGACVGLFLIGGLCFYGCERCKERDLAPCASNNV